MLSRDMLGGCWKLLRKKRDRADVFKHFPRYSGRAPEGCHVDYIGTVTALDFTRGMSMEPEGAATVTREVEPGVTALSFGEEYFEWIDILESAYNADRAKPFVFIELGAGYGRWSAIALKAADRCRIENSFAVLVEAEPQHASWARQHMRSNGFDESRYHLIEAGVAGVRGRAQFLVASPDKLTPATWYGQALSSSAGLPEQKTAYGEYYGKPLFLSENGWGAIEVDLVSFTDILDASQIPSTALIDLIDMDIQGAEAEFVEANIDILCSRVRRMHIGTHSREIEKKLRRIFRRRKWESVWDFPCLSTTATPYGKISFVDGVQGWVNPRL